MVFKARPKVTESLDVFCAELWSLMARNRHGDAVATCLLSGAERKWDSGPAAPLLDPRWTSQGEVDGLARGNPRLTLLLKFPEGQMSSMTALVLAVLGSLYLPGQAFAQHDKARWHGHGSGDLPLDYRSSRRTAVGDQVRAAGCSLSVYDLR